jgi:hypothetical protein
MTTGCGPEAGENCHKRITFYNNYDKDTYIFFDIGYPDTILPLRLTHKFVNGEYTQAGQANGDALALVHPRKDCLEYIFQHEVTDTLMFFVLDVSTVQNNSWQTVGDNYLILQRYDLCLEDMNLLEWSLPFPPTETMKHMKMYPPYGTYNK